MTIAQLLRQHPAPWRVGEEHETMAELWDASDQFVMRLHRSQIAGASSGAGSLAEALITLVNGLAPIEARTEELELRLLEKEVEYHHDGAGGPCFCDKCERVREARER